MTQPTFIEILETAEEIAVESGMPELAFLYRNYPKDPGPAKALYERMIDKATWVLRERVKAIEQLAA